MRAARGDRVPGSVAVVEMKKSGLGAARMRWECEKSMAEFRGTGAAVATDKTDTEAA
jgi:hypothetical protein